MKMTGGQFLARSLQAYGVTHFFFVPSILSWTLAELEGTGLQRIVTHDEKAAGYMADGYGRASGRPGVCGCQAIGTSNLAAGLRDAYMGASPVIAFSGGAYLTTRHRHQYQEAENLPIFAPVTKMNVHVEDLSRLPDLLRQAFRVATSGKPGPVHLELEGHFGEVTEEQEAELEVLAEERFSRIPAFRPRPDKGSVADAVRVLEAAQRPVLVAGGGARSSGASAELQRLAEKLSIPVATSLNAKDTLPADHPLNVGVPGLYYRECANQVILEADVVCFVGSQTGSQVTGGWQVPRPGASVIQIDIDPEELGRHYPNTVSLLGDCNATLAELADAATEVAESRKAWVARVHRLVETWRESVADQALSDAVPIRPERLCRELGKSLPTDALVVADTGHSGFWTAAYLDLEGPDKSFIRAAGSLGWGLPAAIGAKLAVPSRPVLVFTGDGGLWYHLAEIETAVRWGVNLVVIVNDNRSMNEMIPFYEPMYGGELHGRHEELWVFRDVDFAAAARSLGAEGVRVTQPSEITPAIEHGLGSPGPTVIDVATDMQALCPWQV